jgi:hypothetical protein
VSATLSATVSTTRHVANVLLPQRRDPVHLEMGNLEPKADVQIINVFVARVSRVDESFVFEFCHPPKYLALSSI